MSYRTKKHWGTKKTLKEQLKYCFHEEAVDNKIFEKSLHSTLLLANRELQQKCQRPRISFREFLTLQIKYMGLPIWIVQGLLLLGICALLPSLLQYYLAHLTSRGIAALLCCFSTILAMHSISFAYRSSRYGMWEIETVSHFSLTRLLAAKILLSGMGNIILLGAVFTVISQNTSYNRARTLFYLLIPFLLAKYGSLLLQRHISMERLQVCFVWMCFGLPGVIFLLSRYVPICFEQSLSPGWGGMCLILILACVYQLWQMILMEERTGFYGITD